MQTEHQRAREQLVTALLEGRTFQEFSQGSPVPLKRAMAYRLLRAVRTQGKVALQDGRHGHPSKRPSSINGPKNNAKEIKWLAEPIETHNLEEMEYLAIGTSLLFVLAQPA